MQNLLLWCSVFFYILLSFRRGETFGHDLPRVCPLFLLPPVYSAMYSAVPLVELQMSLGLASQGFLHNAGLCHYPFSRRCVPRLQLYSCFQARRPVLIASLHAVLWYVRSKGESLHTNPVWISSQLLCVLQLPIQCWTSTAAFAQCYIWTYLLGRGAERHHSAHLLLISPQIHTYPQQHLPLASRLLSVPKGQIKLPGRKLPILAVVSNDSVLSPVWADTSSFIIAFSKTMLLFVLSMKNLRSSLLTVFHSTHCTQLVFWNQRSNHRWSQVCPGPYQHHIKACWCLPPATDMGMMRWPHGCLLAIQSKWHI